MTLTLTPSRFFVDAHNTARKTRNVICSTLPNSKSIKDTPDPLVTDRGTISDYQNKANEFNKFFCSIATNLANNFSNTSFKSFSTYLNKRVSSSIYVNIPNPTEIFNAIYSLNLKNNKAVGHDDIPAFFLRIASPVIIPYLQVFIEFCFTEGIFPENCTIARIVPIFKKGERDKPTNYCPISILTCFSKIFAELLYKCSGIVSHYILDWFIQYLNYIFWQPVFTKPFFFVSFCG